MTRTQLPLEWMTITSSASPAYMVKGTTLARALCGRHRRFAIDEVRAYYGDGAGEAGVGRLGYPDVEYRVRDAETVTDAEVRRGIISRVVATFRTLEGAEEYVSNASQEDDHGL